jgi:hypothetical protein
MTRSINTLAKLVAIPLLIIFFSACGTVSPYAPKLTKVPTASGTPTHFATFTPRPILLPTATSTPIATLSPIENYVQKMKDLPEKCQGALVVYVEPLSHDGRSPDGNWAVYDCKETSELFIINREGSKAWHLRHDQFTRDTDVPDSISIRHWSNDSQYVYLIPEYAVPCCWDPVGGTSIDSTFNELWQFNVNTGKYFNIFENIASVKSDSYPSMSAISFSPEDNNLLVIPQRWVIPPIVYIYNLEKNKAIHSFNLAGSENSIVAGNVVWSPDGQLFAMTSGSGGDFEYYQNGEKYKDWQFSVIIIDIKTLSQKVIIYKTKGEFGVWWLCPPNPALAGNACR